MLLNHTAFVLNLHHINLELLREIFRNKSTGKQSVWTRNRQVNIMIIFVNINHSHDMASSQTREMFVRLKTDIGLQLKA
jgi:hypothetical protein